MKRITQGGLRALGAGVALAVLAAVSFGAEAPDKTKPDRSRSLARVAGGYQILNINNLWTWMRNDGLSNHSPTGDNGTYYPRGTRWFIYQDGIMWGGKAFSDAALTQPAPFSQLIRVGGANYDTGCRPGRVIGQGATAVAADPGAADSKIWRIRRDYASMSEIELKRDAGESHEIAIGAVTDGQVADIVDRYREDWDTWPVEYGAPYIDRNKNGRYDKPPAFSDDFTADSLIAGGYDEPGVAGGDPNSPADQVVWTVFNDLFRSQTQNLQGSEPLGIEAQLTVWGYKRTDALGNIFFRRIKLINKGGVEIDAAGNKGSFWVDSMYVAQWSDPDLGEFSDDLCGTDTTLSMGFIYNGNPIDSEYRKFGLPPVSGGYDFLAGPLIASPGDSAVFDLKRIHGYKNLGMTSFSYFSAGAPISDPPRDYTRGTLRWYKMLKGFAPVDGPHVFYPFPPGVTPNKYPLSGDPVKGTGFLDGQGKTYSFVPGDRRINLSTGPFSLAPGDTQEVVVALVAGLGADRLSSISVAKFNDRFAQNTYDALFQVAKAPRSPDVKIAELNGEVIVEWGSNLGRVTDTETRVNQPGGFVFEGYNVYQLPSRAARLQEATRIATYDLPDDPSVILDEQFDANSGQILLQPVQFGTNSGILRFFKLDRDYVLDIGKLYNGQEYYLVVTAYSRSTVPGFLPTALESEPTVYTVIPQSPFGKEYQTSFGDTIDVAHTGKSDGVALPIVIDPGASTGKAYAVRFDTTGGTFTWKLVNTTDNKNVLTGQTNQSGDDNYSIVEGGIFLKVSGPPPGVKDWAWTAGSRFLTWAGGADGLGFEGFGGAIGWSSPRGYFGDGTMFVSADQCKKIEIRFANVNADGTFDPNQPNVSYGYRHGRGFAAAPAKPEFAPYIINAAGGYSYQDFTKSVPLAVYDVDATPPRRLAVGHLENNAAGGLVDGKYWPPFYGDVSNTAGSGPREWLWIFDSDYSETPNPDYQVEAIGGPQPIMYYAAWARRNTNPWTDTDVMVITPNRPNTLSDVFTYTLPAPKKGTEQEKLSAQNINVFPNPYYAFNPAETNRLAAFVTFNNLPTKATLRVFNLAGQLVRRIDKDDTTQFARWDMLNHSAIPVASGMYIVHVDMPDVGVTKVLKLAIIQEEQVLDVY